MYLFGLHCLVLARGYRMATSGYMPLCMACLCVLHDNGRIPASTIQSPVAHAVWPDKAKESATHTSTLCSYSTHTQTDTHTGKGRQDFIFAFSLSQWKNDYDSSYVVSVCMS